MRIELSPSDPPRTLDRVMQTHRDPGTEVVLRAGEYTTQGAWGAGQNWERMQAPGVILRAEGGQVRVRLAPDAPRSLDGKPRPERDLRVWTYGHGAAIKGVTFDGRQESFPANLVTAGVRGVGSSEFEDVWAEGLRGQYPATGQAGIEAFGISSIGNEGGSRWTRCGVRNCAPNAYVSAFNVGHVGAKAWSKLTKCKAGQGVGGWLGFGVNERVELEDCESVDVVSHIYNDTDSTSEIRSQGGNAERVQKVLSLVSVDGSRKVDVQINGLTARLVGDPDGVARVIELWDQHGAAEIGGVILESSEITSSARVTHLAAIAGNTENPRTRFRPTVLLRNALPSPSVKPEHPSALIA